MVTGSTNLEPWLLVQLELEPIVLLVQDTLVLVLVVTEPWLLVLLKPEPQPIVLLVLVHGLGEPQVLSRSYDRCFYESRTLAPGPSGLTRTRTIGHWFNWPRTTAAQRLMGLIQSRIQNLLMD